MFDELRRLMSSFGVRASLLRAALFLLALGIAGPAPAVESSSNPLSPPDTSSPGATLKSFRESMEAAYRAFYSSPSVPVPQGIPAQFRGIRCLDTSELPPAESTRLAAEAAVLLNEVLDHAKLPVYEEIPDLATLRLAARGGRIVYRIPGTDISIVEQETGTRKGEFLFSAESVARTRQFYSMTHTMTAQPGSMKGLYRLFSVAPGSMISRSWIEALPNWAKKLVWDQAVWKWFASVLIISIWVIALVLAHRYSRRHEVVNRYWLRGAFALAAVGLTYIVANLLEKQIILIGTVFQIADTTLFAVCYGFGAVVLLNFSRAIAQTIITSRELDSKKIDARLINISFQVVAWLLVVILITIGISRLGVPIEAIVGSLGVGGLAGALAARPTLENLIAGVTLYLDKPVRVGDFCQFGDTFGSVEEIGLRSTRIRQWDGNLISVSNSQFADFQLINYNNMNYILFRGNFGLRLDTSTDQLRFVLAKLREMLFAHPMVNWPRLRLAGIGEDSLKIQLVAYVDTVEFAEYHAVREDLYMRTLEIIEDAGARLAVPVQLTYIARDHGKNEELSTAAEEQVKAWRDEGKLPFPNISADQLEELQHTLDYPPIGSVDLAQPPK